jgi:hypothetical protein
MAKQIAVLLQRNGHSNNHFVDGHRHPQQVAVVNVDNKLM